MVDSIRPTANIGVVKPTGRLRPVEQRKHFRRDPRQAGDEEPGRPSEEEVKPEPPDQQEATADGAAGLSDEGSENPKPGRCIDVRI